MVETRKISPEQVSKILCYEESHFIDLKALEIAPSKLTKTISAFANADGGELYIGISETIKGVKRVWNGFKTSEEANGHIQCFNEYFPLQQGVDLTFLVGEGVTGTVLHVIIPKSSDVKKSSDGTVYVRRGSQNLPVKDPEGLERLRLNKGVTSFENEVLEVPHDVITNSTSIIGFMLEVVPSIDPEPWLRKQRLLINEKPSVAGILLFSDEPQALLPKRCGVKISRYKTKDKEGTRDTMAFDPISIEGGLYDQIESTVKKTTALIEEVSVMGDDGLESMTYPFETLHEIITNALLHRDYSLTNDVQVRIFDNRVEIESPGRLPAHITTENILAERFARNPALVRIINKFPHPPNKDIGEGLNTAFEAMRKLRLKPPVIFEGANSVTVQIRHEPLASPEEVIMEYLDANEHINNSRARELCHIGSENKVKRIFIKMMERNMIERVPGLEGVKAAYRKVSN